MTATAVPQPLQVPAPHTLTLLVYGTPAPQGSKRHVGGGRLIEQNAGPVNAWRDDVKQAALRGLTEHPDWERTYPAICASFTFVMPRPRSHYRTGKHANELREHAPHLHAHRPDLDKLLRSTWDALGAAGVYADDSRIAQVWATKVYPGAALDRPGAVVLLTGVDA